MKGKVIIATTAMLAISGCASVKQLQSTNADVDSLRMDVTTLKAQVHRLANRPQHPSTPRQGYCYLNGHKYSEGAVISGRICEKKFATGGSTNEYEWRFHD